MGIREENKKKLELIKFKRLNTFFEIPIFIDSEMTDYTVTILGDVISYSGYYGPVPYRLNYVIASNGYCKVTLTHNGKQYIRSVHRLVATVFLPNIDNLPEVNHKDGDKTHNWASNLEWTTPKENVKHAFDTGIHKGMKGESHPNHSVTEDQVRQICVLLERGMSYTYIASKIGTTYTIVKKIANRTRWVHISKDYKFRDRSRQGV